MISKQWKIAAAFVSVFLVAYYLPLADPKVSGAIVEAFKLLQWYARNHTLACVVPALFIAGGIITFLSQDAVMRYLGPKSNKFVAYTVASVAGVILAVCSCSVLPIFAGIYQLGAGLGPASAFLYSGPSINILAIFLTARVLGFDIGVWRALGAIGFAFVVGLGMAWLFRKEKQKGFIGALLLGLLFGLVSMPCAGPVLLALLAIVPLSGAAFGAVLLVSYSLGHCGLVLAGGTSMGFVQRLADSRGWNRGAGVLRRVAGVLIVLVGIYLLFA